MCQEDKPPTDEELRLSALNFAVELSRRDMKATNDTVIQTAAKFAAFLKGENSNV